MGHYAFVRSYTESPLLSSVNPQLSAVPFRGIVRPLWAINGELQALCGFFRGGCNEAGAETQVRLLRQTG